MSGSRTNIGHPVGEVSGQGSNKTNDVARIQAFLNMVPQSLGGPMPRLQHDGKIGKNTIAAIKRFQTARFGKCDGVIEPRKQTESALINLELQPPVYGTVHVTAARKQALGWLLPAARSVVNGIDLSGRLTTTGAADQQLQDMVRWLFGVKIAGSQGEGLADAELMKMIRRTFDAAMATIYQAASVLEIGVNEMYGYIAPDKFHELAPIQGVSGTVYVNFKFADWDSVSGYGMGPMTRGALFAQAAFAGFDRQRVQPMTANELQIKIGAASPFFRSSDAVQDASRYLYFCQAYIAGGRAPAKFYHVPSKVGTWEDVADLP